MGLSKLSNFTAGCFVIGPFLVKIQFTVANSYCFRKFDQRCLASENEIN